MPFRSKETDRVDEDKRTRDVQEMEKEIRDQGT